MLSDDTAASLGKRCMEDAEGYVGALEVGLHIARAEFVERQDDRGARGGTLCSLSSG